MTRKKSEELRILQKMKMKNGRSRSTHGAISKSKCISIKRTWEREGGRDIINDPLLSSCKYLQESSAG